MSISRLLFSLLGPGLPLILDKKFCIAMLSSRLGSGFTPTYPGEVLNVKLAQAFINSSLRPHEVMDAGVAAPKLVRLTGELLLLPWQAVASALTLLHKFRASSIAAELPDAVSACRAELT